MVEAEFVPGEERGLLHGLAGDGDLEPLRPWRSPPWRRGSGDDLLRDISLVARARAAGAASGGGVAGAVVAGTRLRSLSADAARSLRDLVLEEDDALEQRLDPRRAARDVDVDGDDVVDAAEDVVGVEVEASRYRSTRPWR